MTQDTKEKILDAAERLFAEHGFPATSMRQITTEASVNLAAVNYHFGSKEALLAAVFERRFVPVNEQRLKLLDALEADAGGTPLDLEPLLRAFLEPPFRAAESYGRQGAKFMQLVGRMHSETNAQLRASFLKLFEEVVRRFLPALQSVLPHLRREELVLRLHFVIGALAHVLVCSQMANPGVGKIERGGALLETLVHFSAAGFAAETPSVTREVSA